MSIYTQSFPFVGFRFSRNIRAPLWRVGVVKIACRLVFFILMFGNFQAWSQVAVGVSDQDLDVRDVTTINGSIWLATTTGAFRLDAGGLVRVPTEPIVVNNIEAQGNDVWLASAIGAYRIRGGIPERIPDEILDVIKLKVIDGSRVCLATANGAYISDGKTTKGIGPEGERVTDVVQADNSIWLATNKAAYTISQNTKLQKVTTNTSFVNLIVELAGDVWIATNDGAYRVRHGGPPKLFATGLDVRRITQVNQEIWMATNKGAYRLTGEKDVQHVPRIDMPVEDILEASGEIWLATNRGAYRIKNGEAERFTSDSLAMKRILRVRNDLWFLSDQGAFVVRGNRLARIPNKNLLAQRIELANDAVWLATNLGAYRVEDISISLTPVSADSWWKWVIKKISPWPILVAGDTSIKAMYVDRDGEPVTTTNLSNPDFRVMLSELEFKYPIDLNQYSRISGFSPKLSGGRHVLYMGVIDKWGNTAEKKMSVLVLPGPLVPSIVLPVLWLVLLSLMIWLAPSSEFIHDLLMNPWLRNVSSFGLIPLAMTTFSPVRRHILKRYVNNLCSDNALSIWLARYQLPENKFSPSQFGERLKEERVLQLIGQSGIGKTSYLKFLTASYALRVFSERGTRRPAETNLIGPTEGAHVCLSPREVIPVFVPLVRYLGKKTDDMVAAQLSSYGRLTDAQIVAWYMQQGGFLFLFDGLNEVDESTRNDVNRFIDEGRRRSLFCISSQETYPPFSWINEVKLSYLDSDSINKILQKQLDPSTVESVISHFSPETYNLYRVPQDLEFLIHMLKEHAQVRIPQTKSQLYESVLLPVFAAWREQGRADFPDILTKRAYEMVVSKDPLLNSQSVQISGEFTSPLLFKKLLVQRDKGYYFQHNLIRDYLASIYLRGDWRGLLSDDKISMDSNWLEMLKFVLEDFSEAEFCKELLYKVLQKNKRIAGELFTWFESASPSLSSGWSSEFKLGYANALLETNHP
jgi:hypothetical protein